MYRGILMPLSSDGDTIDYIYGVINWTEVADQDTAAGIAREAYRAAASLASAEASPVWGDGPSPPPTAFDDRSSDPTVGVVGKEVFVRLAHGCARLITQNIHKKHKDASSK